MPIQMVAPGREVEEEYRSYARSNLESELVAAFALEKSVASSMAAAAINQVLPASPRVGVMLRELWAEDLRVGVALFGTQSSDRPLRYFVWDIVIDENHRGKGFGEAAMRAIESHARQAGAVAIELSVFSRNETAHRLYMKLGYRSASSRLVKVLVGGPTES